MEDKHKTDFDLYQEELSDELDDYSSDLDDFSTITDKEFFVSILIALVLITVIWFFSK